VGSLTLIQLIILGRMIYRAIADVAMGDPFFMDFVHAIRVFIQFYCIIQDGSLELARLSIASSNRNFSSDGIGVF